MSAKEWVPTRRHSDKASSPVLGRIVAGNLCSGCGACSAIAPEAVNMSVDVGGFLRPSQAASITEAEEELIRRVCPGVSVVQEPKGRQDHVLWGPFVAIRSGFSSNRALRQNASSGGALSALLSYLLEIREIDSVLETRAAPGLPIGNCNTLSTTFDGVISSAGSRYAPSAPLAGLGKNIPANQKSAFVGKPCDVAALRAMERFDPSISIRIPVIFSFFCAGVPSLAGARVILEAMGVNERDVVAFRYRGNGWPGSATATLKNGEQREMSYSASWGGILSKHIQPRCKICPDGTGGFADIVCADAWATDEKGYPLFEEQEGISLIISRTEKGERIVQGALASGKIVAEILPDRQNQRYATWANEKTTIHAGETAGPQIVLAPGADLPGVSPDAECRRRWALAEPEKFPRDGPSASAQEGRVACCTGSVYTRVSQ